MAAKDPYRYFRIEARELLDALELQVQGLAKGEPAADLMARLLRAAHTLKGASRVVKAISMAEAAHGLESLLAPFRDGPGPPPTEALEQAVALLSGLRRELDHLGQAAPHASAIAGLPQQATAQTPPPGTASKPLAESLQTLRVEIGQLDRLLESVAEAVLPVGQVDLGVLQLIELAQGLEQSSGELRAERLDALAGQLRRLSSQFSQAAERSRGSLDALRREATELRLLPASLVLEPLKQTLDDACQTLDKRISLSIRGGEFRLDAHVLLPLRDALIQLVRNAASHGIEDAALRQARGKPAEGSIEVSLERRGDRIRFHVRDDGAGIDLDAVRQAAISKGRLSPEQASAAGETQLYALLLDGGLSTAREVTAIAGRGVGLDLVREAVRRARGELSIRSHPGRGCEFLLDVPPSLVAVDVLVVESGRLRACLPLHNVRQALRLPSSAIEHSDSGDRIVIDQQLYPLRRLHSFHSAVEPSSAPFCSVLLLSAGEARAALQVDRLIATREAVVRPLPAVLGNLQLVAGASPDLNGDPLPIFNPDALIQAIVFDKAPPTQRRPVQVLPPILVIDDSLTTRMMEQSILESAGYEVDLAESAEQAFEMARARRYGLFVCDVEMPGMNGFEFVRLSREDADLRQVPVVLVTSLNKPEDKQRGMQAGAADYIVKSEFEQQRFLSTVARLLG
ncbi:hybrid sensor histidine kinase/response regulator [Pseudomarimonas arenosa]|uniref:Chemotaxis protein CheA n=1 Tax=Pseudomarimonas arenosa TaxID=2774145 RepID=A0AAW3ZQ60_9GAMM|nr:response regulator [Pseudomarimonas arenosa]MBD8526769.1 response regulator [Pseudomarimonas arenosa]